jgi:hypothetical protein
MTMGAVKARRSAGESMESRSSAGTGYSRAGRTLASPRAQFAALQPGRRSAARLIASRSCGGLRLIQRQALSTPDEIVGHVDCLFEDVEIVEREVRAAGPPVRNPVRACSFASGVRRSRQSTPQSDAGHTESAPEAVPAQTESGSSLRPTQAPTCSLAQPSPEAE